ncbi:uncharacterized protein LOC115666804 [Syzygium oleosum]|uniref:uncharacterized protein LOC115666804 n=2 Tax=Syzygium oleosum TaxID=219896 RepID=UPI0024B976A8|nr:uncharacterized protein LOC115666804 [Syzygium oleosum]
MEGVESSSNNGPIASVEPIEQVFDDFELNILKAWMCTVSVNMSMHTREPIRDSKLSGPEWIREILYGHSDRIYETFRMERHVFLNLCDLMKARGWLADSRYIRVDEQVGIFLSMISHKNSNRDLCERFQHLGQTISKYFAKVLQAVLNLAREIIVPPSFDVVPEEILINPKYNPYFKGCIGAIDGTHIHASVPVSKQIPFRGRKGITTQNVMCVCSFDMKFTFVYAGWEGSANDCRVLSAALETHRLQFPRPPPGKYYVVDSGYAAAPGFLTPFKGERYHINDFRGRVRQATTARELFNHRHSSLRNVIERSFAVLKNRFFILRHMPSFSIQKQSCIVIACCAIHNYIRDQDKMDKNFSQYGDSEYPFGNAQDEVIDDTSTEEDIEINMLKKRIANQLAIDNNMAEIP